MGARKRDDWKEQMSNTGIRLREVVRAELDELEPILRMDRSAMIREAVERHLPELRKRAAKMKAEG